MKIAVDLDDTQSKFLKKWITKYNELYDDNLNFLSIKEWDVSKYVKCSSDALYQILGLTNFFKDIEPEPYALEVLNNLRAAGHEVVTVTAYDPRSCIDKSYWLKKYHKFEQKDIIFCNNKHFINADLLLDDGLHNHVNFTGKRIVYDRPHNDILGADIITDARVHNWKEFESYCKLNGIL